MYLATTKGMGGDNLAKQFWEIFVGYHKRSLAETVVFRFKKLFGDTLSFRTLNSQRTEVYARSVAINRMTNLGMPRGHWVIV